MTDRKRNAVFFLGAGASAPAGIPTVVPMTAEFVKHIAKAYPELSSTLRLLTERLSRKIESPDIEAILRTLHRLIDHENDEISEFLQSSHKLEKQKLVLLMNVLQNFIRNRVIQPTNVGYLAPLLDSVWGGPIDIFSVNYDPCVELLCRDLQRRLVDGFVPEWSPQSLNTDDATAVCLYKLHGSVLWFQSEAGWPIKIPIGPRVGADSRLELYDGSKADPIMLYPMHKQPIEAPLLDFTYILKHRLESASYVVVIGYSFRDDYLSALFRDAFNANQSLHMVNIGPDSRLHYNALLTKSPSYSRAFSDRVTCIPFGVEKVLSRFTEDFVGFSAVLKKYRQDLDTERIGRNTDRTSSIEPLSRYGEAALSHQLLSAPLAELDIELDSLWVITLRNYLTALVMKDDVLIESTASHVLSCMQLIWRRLRVSLTRDERWTVRCEMIRYFAGGSSSTRDFYSLQNATDRLVKETDRIIFDLGKSQQAIRENLAWIRSSLVHIHDFFGEMGRLQGSSLETFRNTIRPQLVETQEELDAWYLDACQAAPGAKAEDYQLALFDIVQSVLPRVFQDLWRNIKRPGPTLVKAPAALRIPRSARGKEK